MSLVKIINFRSSSDERGSLCSLESNKNIPFDIKRVYYIFGTKPGVSRGFHAHRNLQQVAVCITGSCRFILDDGESTESIILDEPLKGILIESLVWREIYDFTPDCVLMVLASDHYHEKDYIRKYEIFREQTYHGNNSSKQS